MAVASLDKRVMYNKYMYDVGMSVSRFESFSTRKWMDTLNKLIILLQYY